MLYPELTVEAVVAEVRKVAAERPDFIYTDQPERVARADKLKMSHTSLGCSYIGAFPADPGESPVGHRCIVGQALKRLGVLDADLEPAEGQSASSLLTFIKGTSPIGSAWLNMLQGAQDTGRSWSKAVAHADAECGKVGA